MTTNQDAMEAAIKAAREAVEDAPYLDREVEVDPDGDDWETRPQTYREFFEGTWQGSYADDVFQTAAEYAAQASIAAYLAAREAEGFVMVPLSPTPQMLANGSGVFTSIQMPWDTAASVCYAHMLAARPKD